MFKNLFGFETSSDGLRSILFAPFVKIKSNRGQKYVALILFGFKFVFGKDINWWPSLTFEIHPSKYFNVSFRTGCIGQNVSILAIGKSEKGRIFVSIRSQHWVRLCQRLSKFNLAKYEVSSEAESGDYCATGTFAGIKHGTFM